MGNIDLSNISIANIQTISGMTMPEILQQMKSLGIGISGDNYTIQDYSDIITGTIAVGGEVTMGGYPWIVTSIQPTDRIFYMISKNVISTCKYANSASAYAKSTLATVAKSFADSLPSNVQDALLTRSTAGVSQKCHAPTYSQVTSWFTDDSTRIAYYNSNAQEYWLCDNGYDADVFGDPLSTSYALTVNAAGECSNSKGSIFGAFVQATVGSTKGFRAVVALMM